MFDFDDLPELDEEPELLDRADDNDEAFEAGIQPSGSVEGAERRTTRDDSSEVRGLVVGTASDQASEVTPRISGVEAGHRIFEARGSLGESPHNVEARPLGHAEFCDTAGHADLEPGCAVWPASAIGGGDGVPVVGLPSAESASLAIGNRVEIRGLRSRADLNGQRATILLHDEDANRLEVRLDGAEGERVRCKPDNLRLIAIRTSINKTKGDDAFRDAKLDEALHHYRAALSEDGAVEDTEFAATIYSNLSATYAKRGEHGAALREADLAVRLRPHWAKGHSRRGLSLLNLGRNEDAQASYIRAVKYDCTVDGYLAGLRQATERRFDGESTATRQRESEEQKAKGNEAMKSGQVPMSIAHYTMALAVLGSTATEFSEGAASADSKVSLAATCSSNRSAAFAKLGQWNFALADAHESARLKPQWFKAHLRIACAELGTGHAENAYLRYLTASDLPGGYEDAVREAQRTVWQLPRLESPLARRRMARFAEDAKKQPGFCRIFAISDVHIDHAPQVVKWAEGISNTEFRHDILLVAGDLGDTFNAVKRGLELFKRKFRRVFYVPGNHDMWIRPNTQDSTKLKFKDSIAKLLSFLDMCDSIGAEMMPAEVMQDVYVVPLLSWWSCTFDVGDPRPGDMVFDKYCKWPMGEEGAHKFFLNWNDRFVSMINRLQKERGRAGTVITFSHFLPCFDIFTSNAPVKASGCLALEDQVKALQAQLHIFGHTHMNFSHTCRGVTYQQHSLMSPEYGHSPTQSFLKLYDMQGLHLNAQRHNVY